LRSANTDAVQNRAQVNAEIRSIARIAGLGQEFVDGLIDRGASADEARRAAFDELARRGGGALRTGQTRVEVSKAMTIRSCEPATWAKRSMHGSIRQKPRTQTRAAVRRT
jgi:hypothetical protein